MSGAQERDEELEGRLAAIEIVLTHSIWRWASEHKQPPLALATFLRPLETTANELLADRTSQLARKQAMHDTIRRIATKLEQLLHAAALRNTPRTDSEPH